MSKFQSFASQPSFRDYQIQVPDETAKIREETERTIRGQERAQRFLEGNNEIYLRAQKLAQEQEEMSRETNFRLESENRKAYKDALDRDYNIQTQNDKARADQLQRNFRDLSAFSKTASELFVEVNTKITENQTNANTVNTLLAGTTFQENLAIQSMVNNLTEAEFAQQDFIKQKVAEGKDVKALWALYNNRNTRGFLENAGVIQNTANTATPFLQETLRGLDPNLSVEEKRIKVETAYREWLATSFRDATGKTLNPKLVANIGSPIFNRAYTNVMGEFDRQAIKENEEKLRLDTFAAYDLAWANGGVVNILKEFTTNPSKAKRESITEWALARLEAGTLAPEDLEGLITTTYVGPNGNTTWEQQLPSDASLGKLREGLLNARRRMVGEANLEEQENKLKLDETLKELYNQFAQDGSITKEEYAEMEKQAIQLGVPGYDSPILKEAYEQQDSVRYEAAAEEMLTKQFDQGTLTIQSIQGMKGISGALKQKFLNLAIQQEKQRETPAYKTDIAAIKAAVSQDPRLTAAPVTGDKNYSVLLMQDRYVQMYKATLARTGDANQARATTLAAIQTLLSNPQSINKYGQYTEIVEQEAQFANKAKGTLENYQRFLKAAKDPDMRKNPQKLAQAFGTPAVTKAYGEMKAGSPPSEMVRNAASLMRMSPLEFVNYLASGVDGSKMPPITLNSQLEQIRANMKPITRKLYNTYRTNERTRRANAMNAGNNLSTAPTRGDELSRFRAAIIAKESGGSYTVVNPDSGAIGIGQVMPENVGPWTQRYLGRRLTPEQFRANPAAQDAVINGRFKDMLNDQRAAGYKGEVMIRRAAAVWYSGRGDLWNNTKPEYYNGRRYPSIAEYTLSIWKKFQSNY